MVTGAHLSPQPLRIAGESSLSSAESTFRELDDIFLQTQTRIWIGEVLRIRLSEQLSISDLLADGELLLEVSRVVWKMLLTRSMEFKHTKWYKYDPFASKKSSGKYTPYSNVDSFLKICKILGLSGIDLFSPSDVVEKRNTRKVCLCIRFLSMKARSKHLNVPDFDIVSSTVSMPTDMVGFIRRSLELSQCSFSLSVSYNSSQNSGKSCRQENSIPAFARNYYSYSEESDNAECNSLQSEGSSTNCSTSAPSQTSSDSVHSPGVHSVVVTYPSGSTQFKCQSLSSNKSAGSLFSQHMEHDSQLDSMLSPSSVNSQKHLIGRASNTMSGLTNQHENCSHDFSHVHPHLGSGGFIWDDSGCCKTPERSDVAHQLDISSVNYHGTDVGAPIMFHKNDSTCDAYACTGSYGSNTIASTTENGFESTLSDIDDEEVSSAASMCSVSGPMLTMDFDYPFGIEDDSKTAQYSEVQDQKTNLEISQFGVKIINVGCLTNPSLPCSDAQTFTRCYEDHAVSGAGHDEDKLPQIYPSAAKNVDGNIIEIAGEESNALPNMVMVQVSETSCELAGTDDKAAIQHCSVTCPNLSEPMPVVHSCLTIEYPENVGKSNHQANSHHENFSPGAELRYQDNRQHQGVDALTSENYNESPKQEARRRPLLNSVVKGSAVLGVLFLLLHLRKNGRDKPSGSNNETNQTPKANDGRFSMKEKKGATPKGVYPAEKLKLGD